MRKTKRLVPVRKKAQRRTLCNVLRWSIYLLLMLLAFVTASAGDYVKPLWLIPISFCIASVHGTVIAAVTGILCGLLMDISCGTLPGYHGILLFLMCMLISILYDRLMQQRFWNLVFFTGIAAFLVTSLDYIFQYAIWGYDNVSLIYVYYALPCLLYTLLSCIVCYPVFRLIHRFLLPQRKRTVQRTIQPLHDD